MPKIKYTSIRISEERLTTIDRANEIIAEYTAQGFDLTLRQLYYQFVARGLLANKQQEYKRLGDIIGDGRLAGLIDWNAITDRTRNLETIASWDDPADIVNAAARSFQLDLWSDQATRIEVWIEKDALKGVIEPVCRQERIPHFSCRGYTSLSEVWSASQRFVEYNQNGQKVVILHLGDHDPSGIDMSRDIEARLETFGVEDIEVRRLALNMDQVRELEPPPNPAKLTDSRATDYIAKFGDESWELDALDPPYIARLIREEVRKLRNRSKWTKATATEDEQRRDLTKASERWEDVAEFLNNGN